MANNKIEQMSPAVTKRLSKVEEVHPLIQNNNKEGVLNDQWFNISEEAYKLCGEPKEAGCWVFEDLPFEMRLSKLLKRRIKMSVSHAKGCLTTTKNSHLGSFLCGRRQFAFIFAILYMN